MKLSKLTLEWLIYHAQHSDVAGHTELKIIEEINEALLDNTLEIDGYEKSEWIKLDKNDLKTFPQIDGEEVLLYVTYHEYYGKHKKIIIHATVNWISNSECYFSDFNGDEVHNNVDDITHWQPLPNPPTETEVQK